MPCRVVRSFLTERFQSRPAATSSVRRASIAAGVTCSSGSSPGRPERLVLMSRRPSHTGAHTRRRARHIGFLSRSSAGAWPPSGRPTRGRTRSSAPVGERPARRTRSSERPERGSRRTRPPVKLEDARRLVCRTSRTKPSRPLPERRPLPAPVARPRRVDGAGVVRRARHQDGRETRLPGRANGRRRTIRRQSVAAPVP
jgi:hypothetical protein